MKVRKLLVISIALAIVCLLSNVYAAPTDPPTGSKDLQASEDNVEFYHSSTMLAEVDTYVWRYTDGPYEDYYLYTYDITGKSVYCLSFFSIAVSEDVTFYEMGYASPGTEPSSWGSANTPAQSIDAWFSDTIDYGEDSAQLWFVSDGSPTSASASVFGTNPGNGFQAFAGEQLYSPIPEPATLVILGIGSLCLIGRKRK